VTVALARAGCRTFFVADLAEGRRVREKAPTATIYVLNGMPPQTGSVYAAANLHPVVGSLPELEEWRAFKASSGWAGGAALHIDTGMNRLGLTLQEVQAAHPDTTGIGLVMSHLACAETPAHPLNARQLAAFQLVRTAFPGILASLANSSGIFLGPDAHHDLVRPGVALYGGNPTPSHANPMRPVVELKGRIVQVRAVPAGQTVGYGATWTAQRTTTIAVVAVGYADGFLRAASARDNKIGAEVIVNGHRCHLAGLVSMDLLAIDVTDVALTPKHGDLVTLLGEGIGVDDLAARAATIGYEILTSLGPRYARNYKGG
jgi:alanine racemase